MFNDLSPSRFADVRRALTWAVVVIGSVATFGCAWRAVLLTVAVALGRGDLSHSFIVPCLLAQTSALSETDPRPEAKPFESGPTAQRGPTMKTLFDDIVATLLTAVLAIASASAMVAMVATSLPTVI